MITLPKTNLQVFPLCLGGNVFGWSADITQSFEVLDAYFSRGGNFIDTADAYSAWVQGNRGGESETIIGEWMRVRQNRDSVVVATKAGKLPTYEGLKPTKLVEAVENSLQRLQIQTIDILYAHADDLEVRQNDYLSAFDSLVRAGKVRYIAASNFSGDRLRSASEISKNSGLSEFIAIQNEYNLLNRTTYELDTAPAITDLGIAGIPYFGLARGFLTGKYRPGVSIDSVRASGITSYQNSTGDEILERLKIVANNSERTFAQIALAWLRSQPAVSVPIASARTVDQLHEIATIVELTSDEVALLSGPPTNA
jgi:aryl-alcohol dehydrogenase-like predicted oxidoreductase